MSTTTLNILAFTTYIKYLKYYIYIYIDEISPLRCTSVVRSESDGIASKQMRLVRASMTILSYIHKD